MPTDTDLNATLRDLFASQLLAVLATTGTDGPYASLVAFAANDDLNTLVFATGRSTAKFKNMLVHRPVSLLIDNRDNSPADFSAALAVTALGEAVETLGPERQRLRRLFLARHPDLWDFVHDPATALMQVKVRRYIVVDRFQRARPWTPDNLC